MLYNTALANLQENMDRLLKAQEVVSSGKRINRPSDDPVGAYKLLGHDTVLSKTKQYQRNIDRAVSFLSTTESVVSGVNNLLVRAKELAIQEASATSDAQTRYVAEKEVEQIFSQMLQMANTKHEGKYIFAGFKTNTPPYDSSGNYSGTDSPDGEINVEVGAGIEVAINLPGYKVFGAKGGVEALKIIDDFKTALKNNDVAGIQDAIDKIDLAMNQIQESWAEIGARISQLNSSKDYLSSLEAQITQQKSDVEDADIAKAITELAQREHALEASRGVTARILSQPSLIDFLR